MNSTNTLHELACMDSRKSFYGKAATWYDADGNYWLRSYNTDVGYIDGFGNFHRTWHGYSATTMRHVNSFLLHAGVSGGGKSWWDSMEVEQ